jgi:hypothetical protein
MAVFLLYSLSEAPVSGVAGADGGGVGVASLLVAGL